MAEKHINSLHLDSRYLYRFLGTVWDHMPQKDRMRFAELWKGFEQVFGDLLVRGFEHDLAANINDMSAFMTQRWNRYTFDDAARADAAAVFLSQTDLGEGADLTAKWLVSFETNKLDGQGRPLSATQVFTVDCRGNLPHMTTAAEVAEAINEAVGYALATTEYSGTLVRLTTLRTGPDAVLRILRPADTAHDATSLIFGLVPSQLPYETNPFPWRYKLPTTHRVWSIPTFQNKVRDVSVEHLLTEGTDYVVTPEKWVSFKSKPPVQTLWARDTRVDERLPAYKYGWLLDYVDTERHPSDYLFILQGLWFAYWNGPRPEFIRRCLYLLLGLPVVIQDGVVASVIPATTTQPGEVAVVESATGDTVLYTVPAGLAPDVVVGQVVARFTPISTGIEIIDKVSKPGFVTTDLGRGALGRFLLPGATLGEGDTDETKAMKLLEEHTFLPQINVFAFVRDNVSIKQVRQFLDAIKPLHKTYHLQMIIAAPDEPVDVVDKLAWSYDVNITPTLDSNLAIKQTGDVRERYELQQPPDADLPLYLDSEDLQFTETVTIVVSDRTGPRPDLGRVFYA